MIEERIEERTEGRGKVRERKVKERKEQTNS
jgi:hypothetical protein